MTELKCSVFMCYKTENDGVSFHEFPENYTRPWIIAVDLGPTWIPKHTSRMCSDHFHEDAFKYDLSNNTRVLRTGWAPSIMKPDPIIEESIEQPIQEPIKEQNKLMEMLVPKISMESLNKEEIVPYMVNTRLQTENPDLWAIMDILMSMRNELQGLELEVKNRSEEPWSDNQFQNIFTKVNNAQEKLEILMKKNPESRKQVKLDAEPEPIKLEPTEEDLSMLNNTYIDENEHKDLDILKCKSEENGKIQPSFAKSESKPERLINIEPTVIEFDDDLKDLDFEDFTYYDDQEDNNIIEEDIDHDDDNDYDNDKKSNSSAKLIEIKCVVCDEISTPKKLKSHILENHGKEGPYQCMKCGETPINYEELRKHTSSHHRTELVQCDICLKEVTRQRLSSHKRTHSENLQQCEICQKHIVPVYMSAHMRKFHKKEKHYKCDVCEKTFSNGFCYKMHLRVHTDERPYSCETCGKAFKQIAHLRTHIDIMHKGNKLKYYAKLKAMCGTCGKVLNSKKSLQIHERTHTGEKPYKCDQCDKSFSQISSLTHHKDMHNSGKFYSCDQCGKSMKFKQALKKHMKTHEPDYENKTFSCDACNIIYKAKFNLRRHIRVFHEGIKPYPCEVCKQAFSNTTTLRQHMRVHTGEKPFQCEICNKSFTQASSLYSHKKKCN